MKNKLILTAILLFSGFVLQSFCGFYVSTGNQAIFNKASEVIMVRDGNRNIITMKNDFQGNPKDFAMVIPVPVVLKEKDIKVVKNTVFTNLNKYSEPRLVEYFDQSPCYNYENDYKKEARAAVAMSSVQKLSIKDDKISIEAEYKVGEFQILILSAKESSGLKNWLVANNYQIPDKAEEVLEPYIKQNLKFFVVKVDVEEMKKLGRTELSPIQISYESDKFMLPIRLGMANAKDFQDLIVYAFTKKGRVECTNYRTAKIPTNKNLPLFIKPRFQEFYKDMFQKQYTKTGKNAVFLEYAWNLSANNSMKCDPCSFSPPSYTDLKDAGISFVNYSSQNWGIDYEGDLFFTRLHVRYDRENFPNDLLFQETPNTENFQGRYIMQHNVDVNVKDCDGAKNYLISVLERRENELENLEQLTNWDSSLYSDYTDEIKDKLGYKKEQKSALGFVTSGPKNPFPYLFTILFVGILSLLIFKLKNIRKVAVSLKTFFF